MPDEHLLYDRNSDIPVRIAYSRYEPEVDFDFIEGKAHGAGTGAVYGLSACDSGDPLFDLICLPFAATIGAIHGAVKAESSSVVESHEFDLQKSIPKTSQKKLANSVHERLADATADFPMFINGDAIDDVQGIDNYRTMLEVTLKKVMFKGHGLANDPICLYMQAKATKYDVTTGKQLDTMETEFNGDCASYDDWVKEGGRKVIQEIESGYEILSENVADEFYLVYQPSVKHIAGPKSSRRYVPEFVLAPTSPALKEPHRFINFQDPALKGGLKLTYVYSLTPTFRWEIFPRSFDDFTLTSNEPRDITYEFRLYEGRLTEHGAWDLVRPFRVLHTVRGLRDNYYTYPEELRACGYYFWTVRAKFYLNGYPRVTEWAGVYETSGSKVSPSYSRRSSSSSKYRDHSTFRYFPIRTGRC